MPSIDDQLKDRLHGSAPRPAGADDLFVRLGERRRRRATTRKVGTVGLVVAVLAGTVGGFVALDRAFRAGPTPAAPTPSVANGALVVSIPDGNDSHLMVLPPSAQDLDPADGSSPADRSSMDALTSDLGTHDVDPAVSPDGSTVAFVRKDASAVPPGLWLIGIDGTDERPVTRAPADVKSPVWSPDGSLIAFSAADEPEGRALYTIHPDGTDLQVVVRGQDVQDVAWSPDGGSIVYSAADVHIPGGSYDLWKVAIDGTDAIDLTSTASVDETDPTWSPDGASIAFVTPDGIRQMPAGGGQSQLVVLTSPSGDNSAPTSPAWSPDGAYLSFVLEPSSVVYVLPTGSVDPFPVAHGSSVAWQPVPLASPTLSIENLGLDFQVCRVMSMPITVAGAQGNAYVFTRESETCPKAGEGMRLVAADLNGDGVLDTTPIELDGCFPPVGCETFAAPDVNADGTSEIAVSNAGADGYGVWLFAVTSSPPTLTPVQVEHPGGIGGSVPSGPLEFAWVDVATHFESVTCSESSDGQRSFSVVSGEKVGSDANLWSTALLLEGSVARVVDAGQGTVPLADAPVPGNQLCGSPLFGSASNFPEAQASEGQDIGLSFNVCDVQSLSGVDLLGDGTDGTAWTGTRVGGDGRCPDPTSTDHLVAIDYTGDGKADGFDPYALPYCFGCRPFGTTDLKGDGHEQLVLVAQEGSEVQYTMMVADIREDGVWFGLAFVRNDTGHAALGLKDGDPFTFWAGGDEGRDEYVECLGSPTRIKLTEFSMPIDGPTRSIDDATFEMHGSEIVLVDSQHSEQPATDPVPDANTGPTCGGLDFDPWA
jgi:Tol biopolymer transport system component